VTINVISAAVATRHDNVITRWKKVPTWRHQLANVSTQLLHIKWCTS